MSSTAETADLDRCPSCGVAIEGRGQQRLCPACLMSGVLRAGADDPKTETGLAGAMGDPSRGVCTEADPDLGLPRDLGGYTLVAHLGRGGMGTVYEAVQRSTGRRLALKVLSQNIDSRDMRQRFLREGRLAARVNHPCSLYVFGSEEIDGIPVITMEIAAGGTLQDVLDRRGALPVTEAVDATLNMIDGLEAALDRGVLHRDVKPSNCFVSPDHSVKVGDFGLSVSMFPSTDSFATQTGKVMGTPAFAAPEQLRGDGTDARSDIYSVGATLFTLLTARAPFEGTNAVQIVANVIDSPPAQVASLRDDVPAGLANVVAKCLAKEPSGRYADYASLRNALLPYSSLVREPAMQSQRTAAGWIDYLTAFLPTYAAMMVTVGPERLFIRPLYEFSFSAWRYHLTVFAVGFLYFALTEGRWGAGLGKWIMGLRVVTRDGRAPRIGRALLRIAIPIAVIEAVRIPLSVASLPAAEWSMVNVLVFTGLAIFCPWVVALLWLPARRDNGFATAWDLLTGTRVVVRPRELRRATLALPNEHHAAAGPERCVGPFRVITDIAGGSWLSAEDPTLRRPIWLVRREAAGPSEARRSVARPGRSRWLQQIDDAGVVWDAYEADRGTPLSDLLRPGGVRWALLRGWLHDVAAELRAAERDGTALPSYGFDHVWITEDGRAMLLDMPWPQAEPADELDVQTLESQQTFLKVLADQADPLSVPLHARPVLDNLRSGSFDKMTFVVGTLRGLLNKPADTSVGLRAASLFVIPGYATIATFLGIVANTDHSVGPLVWAGRAAIAALVMMHFVAFFDFVLAFFRKSTGLTTFGLEVLTFEGRASRARLLFRCAIMWLPLVAATTALGVSALASGAWISFESAALLGAAACAVAAIYSITALAAPKRGLHDRFAGVWIGRR
ncbi:MAG: protein kinase [Planctomycetota bacterium]